MNQQLTREEQELKYPEYTWDLTTIFPNNEAFEEAFKEVENDIGKEEQFKGHLGDSAETLYEALALEDEIGTKLERCMFMLILNKTKILLMINILVWNHVHTN